MIEAMACGTPVIAYRRGSVPEIIEENVSGFVVDTIDEAVRAVRWVASLDRAKVRAQFERRFTVERMAGDYVDIYSPPFRARRDIPEDISRPAASAISVEWLLPAFLWEPKLGYQTRGCHFQRGTSHSMPRRVAPSPSTRR